MTASEFLRLLLQGDVDPDANGCILWPYALDLGGYARVRHDGENRPVARIVLGDPPSPDAHACHAPHEVCGNRRCVARAHLRWGTPAENMADQYRDGTRITGEDHPAAVLTEEQVVELRLLAADGVPYTVLGEKYGIHPTSASEVARGLVWRDVDGPISSPRRRQPALDPDQQAAVREAYAAGAKQRDLAANYGVGVATINRTINGDPSE